MIEASIGRQDLRWRAAVIEKLGFRFFDRCDDAYDNGRLALIDLVMINKRLREVEPKFKPWQYRDGKARWNKRRRGFKTLEDEPFENPFD